MYLVAFMVSSQTSRWTITPVYWFSMTFAPYLAFVTVCCPFLSKLNSKSWSKRCHFILVILNCVTSHWPTEWLSSVLFQFLRVAKEHFPLRAKPKKAYPTVEKKGTKSLQPLDSVLDSRCLCLLTQCSICLAANCHLHLRDIKTVGLSVARWWIILV